MKVMDREKIVTLNCLTEEEDAKVFIPSNFKWINQHVSVLSYNGDFYVAKNTNRLKIRNVRNELIGSYLAKAINLDAVEYKIAEREIEIGYGLCIDDVEYKITERRIENGYGLCIASKLFFDAAYKYDNAYAFFRCAPDEHLTDEDKNSLSFLCKTEFLEQIEDKSLRSAILKLIMLDLKMFQRDRHEENIIFKTKDGITLMEKAFDFGESYIVDNLYGNPFLLLQKNEASLEALAKKFPEISHYASILSSIDIRDVLYTIQNEESIIFNEEEFDGVTSFDKRANILLKSIK